MKQGGKSGGARWLARPFRRVRWPTVLAAVASLAFGHWFAIAAEHLVRGVLGFDGGHAPRIGDVVWTLACLGAFLVSILFALEEARRLIRPRTLSVREAEPCEVILIALSALRNERLEFGEGGGAPSLWLVGPGDSQAPLLQLQGGGAIEADLAALASCCDGAGRPVRFPWEQTLRALRSSASRLRRVHVIVSPQSAAQVAGFERLVHCYWPDVRCLPSEPLEFFGGFEAALTTISELLDRELAGEFCGEGEAPPHESRIALDITGGTAMISTALAAATLRGEAVFQYVATADRHEDKVVRQFDVVVDPRPSAGH